MPEPSWSFYGRQAELDQLGRILDRRRWFFAQISGRRRIGKTSLIQQALAASGERETLYVQIPDSDPAGVVSAFNGYLDTFGRPERVDSLQSIARLVGTLVRQGCVVALDEFQYFHRKPLFDFCSLLQAEVDGLAQRPPEGTPGGLIVLGSLHAEMSALLEDRTAPLFNRTTDVLHVDHLDIASVLAILDEHADRSPERLLFLWSLFEGVPKFYRDAHEQGVLGAPRRELLERLFFRSSSPLRTEADNWFLRELRGRYDALLHYLARHPGASNADIEAAMGPSVGREEARQVGGYLKVLSERYRMIERRLPILSPAKARSGRYHLRDNFLRAWLAALQRPVAAMNFKPLPVLIAQADERLAEVEGHALEALAGKLYEERSRRGLGDFPLSARIQGYWDRSDVEIDLVALDADAQRIRFGTCKRDASRLPQAAATLRRHAERFIALNPAYRHWQHEFTAIAPSIPKAIRETLASSGSLAEDLVDLTASMAEAGTASACRASSARPKVSGRLAAGLRGDKRLG